MREIVDRAIAVTGVRGRVWGLPDGLIRINVALITLFERLVPVPPAFSSESLRSMSSRITMTVQTNKARVELGWAPCSIDHSLRETLADELTRRGKKLPALLDGVSPQARCGTGCQLALSAISDPASGTARAPPAAPRAAFEFPRSA